MPKRILTSKKFPTPTLPFSLSVEAGGFLFISGQTAYDKEKSEVVKGIAGQTRVVLDNIKTLVEEANLTMNDVVSLTIFISDLKKDFAEYNEVYRQYFPKDHPSRTTVEAQLAREDLIIEINAIAYGVK